MKIKVADLEPNPYRDFNDYEIDRERVDGLKDSIKKDEFWGGIPVRPHPTQKGKYQIGSGHHRLLSLKENKVKEVDITAVHPYSDAQMLRIMINENAQYAARPKLVNADVEKARNNLQEWINQYETWEKASSDNNIRAAFSSREQWATPKGRGVGRGTILTYLGKPWAKRGWMIQAALATLKDEKEGSLNRDALETIPTIDQANIFRAAVKKHKIPKPTQKKLANQIVKEGIGSKHIPDLVAEHSILPIKREKTKPKSLPMLDDFVKETCSLMSTLYTNFNQIKGNLENIQSKRLRKTFGRDSKELAELILEVFKNEA